MHPLKIIILLVLFYLVYRLYLSGRKKRLAEEEAKRRASRAIDDVLVQDPVCGAYVASGRALVLRRGDEKHHFCSEECRRKFAARE